MRDGGVRVPYAWNSLHHLSNEQANIRIWLKPELRQQIILARNGIKCGQRSDVIGQLAGNFVGLAELTLQVDKKRLHDWSPYTGVRGD
jgi:hypothetical protein